MPPEDNPTPGGSGSRNAKSARKSTSSFNQQAKVGAPAAGAPSAALPAVRSPQQAPEPTKRARKWPVDLRKVAWRARQRINKKRRKDSKSPEAGSQSASQRRGPGFQLQDLPRGKNVSKNPLPLGAKKSSSSNAQAPPASPPLQPSPARLPAQQNPRLAAGARKTGQQPVPASPPATPLTGAKRATMPAESPDRQRRGSIMNLTKLVRDGRKPPDHYREVARKASSPSNIALKSLTTFYDLPTPDMSTIDDVYAYRGYKKIAKLDEGAFGIVYRATRLGDSFAVALKEVDLSRRRSKRIEEMKRELFVLQKVESPCIVRLIEHFIVSNTLVIIMELCEGSNLTHYLKESVIQEPEALHLFKQMATGLKIMHRAGIAHRDVKLNNFLLDATRKVVKVADFGLSVVSYKQEQGVLLAKTYCGTEPYMSPEILRRTSGGFRQYNPMHADVWALGVCLYAMLTRTFPFKMNLSQKTLYNTQAARRWRMPRSLRDSLSEDLKDLLWHMLDPQADRRITMIGVMTHPWLTPELVSLSHGD